jgi:hypothetical protein
MRKLFYGAWAGLFLILSLTTTLYGKEPDAKTAFLGMSLAFVKNDGQKDGSVLFYERGIGHATAFTKEGVSLFLSRSGKFKGEKGTSEEVNLVPVNGGAFTVESEDPQEGTVNFFIGNDPKNWRTGIPTYGAVLYRGVYPGIDMKFYGTNSQIEYDIIVSPKADPAQVRLSYKGIRKLSLTPEGELEITLLEGSIFQKKPLIYQIIGDRKVEVEGRFILTSDTTYGFEVASYDNKHPLIIDPVLVYSTYLGGGSTDAAYAIAVDGSGNAYVTGSTYSTDFPLKNPIQSYAGAEDIFVTKINTAGAALFWSIYLGGSGSDIGTGIQVDSSGNVYVAGHTTSIDFPTQTPYQGANAGSWDVFVTKINAAGNTLLYSTYLGGTNEDSNPRIAIDSSRNVYLAGQTNSANYPIRNPFQRTHGGGTYDAFVTKLNTAGSALVYSTYLGGSGDEEYDRIAIDSKGCAYVAGRTSSTNFPTKTPFQAARGGGTYDGYVTKFTAAGSALMYSSYLGGTGDDGVMGIAVDSLGNAYVAGSTDSLAFPRKNPFQIVKNGGSDAFVTKINPAGTALVYSTYLGGNSTDWVNDIAVDGAGYAYVTGNTWSWDFPTKNPYQAAHAGYAVNNADSFVSKLSPAGNVLLYSTYLGGASHNTYGTAYMYGDDYGNSIALTSSGIACVVGQTENSNFPTLNAFRGYSGDWDGFVAKFDFSADLYTPDILWRSTANGTDMTWHMDGAKREAIGYFPAEANQDWKIVGTGYFNGDQRPDILWRNIATGQNRVWYMDALTYMGTGYPPVEAELDWKAVAVGDFNGDGHPDIVWRNTSDGRNRIWNMNGMSLNSSADLPVEADQNWIIVGVGDFNKNGKPDILWRNISSGTNKGKIRVWYMDGATRTGTGYITTLADLNWKIVGVGDFNKDGNPDILWRSTSNGSNQVWYMNGVSRTGGASLASFIDQSWQIVGVK